MNDICIYLYILYIYICCCCKVTIKQKNEKYCLNSFCIHVQIRHVLEIPVSKYIVYKYISIYQVCYITHIYIYIIYIDTYMFAYLYLQYINSNRNIS